MDKIINWKIESRKVSELIPNTENPRTISPEKMKKLKSQIKRLGFHNPIKLDHNGKILGGNQRYKSLLELCPAEFEVPVMVPPKKLTNKQYDEILITDNVSDGDWDFKALAEGWDVSELIDWGLPEEMFPEVEPEVVGGIEDDEVPDVKGEPVTMRGDIWLLGEHRVMCGNSTMIDDVEKLMAGDKADMVFTDPPYGIGEANKNFKSREKIAKPTEYHRKKWDNEIPSKDFFQILLSLNIPSFVFGGNYFTEHLPPSGSWVVWNKKNGANDFSDCELAWSNHRAAVRYYEQTWHGMIREGEAGKRVHPTQKPIALGEFCFNLVGGASSVLDFYLGSGSTLISCEKTNRKCYGMELDEYYCDVIVNRWQKFTGKEAKLEATGKTYNDLLQLKEDTLPRSC